MKRHFDVLDGLRGTVALLVVVFHVLETIFPAPADNPLRHAYLAVDFFFLLSGFVVGYAYDARWPALRVRDFLRLRLVRLHPLVLLSAVLGALCYWLDPFVGQAQHVSALRLLGNFALAALLLPSPGLPNRADLLYPLNSPGWSLLQEYLANVAYAVVGARLSRRGLQVLVAVAALALLAAAVKHGNLQGGWGRNNWWMAPVRVTFPFFAGLLVYRQGLRLNLPGSYAWLSILLLGLFAAPASRFDAYYEAGCVLLVFPLIVAAGAGTAGAGRLHRLCSLSGQLSYPLYLVHYPLVQVYGHWLTATHPAPPLRLLAAGALIVFCLGLAWVALRWYDEPVRAWLSAYLRRPHPKAARQ